MVVWSRRGVRELPFRGRAFGWSPDGSRFLVQRSAHLYAVRADGSGEVLLARHGNGFNAAWSPDGTRIALQRKKPGTDGSRYQLIEVVRADGTRRRRIAGEVNDGGWFSGNLSWSPDGARLLFAGRTVTHQKPWLFVAATDGSSPPKALAIEADIVRPTQATWSPDGTRIAFVANAPQWPGATFGDLYVMRADGSGVRRLVLRAARAHGPVWAPDSSRVAYRAGDYEVVRANGTGRIRLPGRASWAGMTWSPDSKWLAQIGGSSESLWLVRADGTRLTRVLQTPGSWYAFPLWRGGTATTEAR